MSTISKNLYDIAVDKGFKTTKELGDYIKGKKMIIVKALAGRSTSSHNYKPKFTQDKSVWINNSFGSPVNLVLGKQNGYPLCAEIFGNSSIYIHEIELVTETKEDFVNRLKDVTDLFLKEEAELKSKINTLDEFGIDEYDEKLIKTIKAMSNIEFKEGSEMNATKLAKMLLDVE